MGTAAAHAVLNLCHAAPRHAPLARLMPGRPFIGGLLARGLAAPALVNAASVAVPFISTCDHAGIPGRGSAVDLRAALGLAVGVGVLVAQPDATECSPKPKGKGRAAPAAQPPPAKKKAGPALDAIAAAPHRHSQH